MKLIGNFLLAFALFFVFHRAGWIGTVREDLEGVLTMCALGAILFTIVSEIVALAWLLFVVGTCGLGCLLYPVIFAAGALSLWGMTQIFPNEFFVNVGWMQVAIMSLALGMLRIPSEITTTPSNNTGVSQ